MSGSDGGRRAVGVSLAFLGLFLLFSYGSGEDSYVRVNDHLDGIVPFYKLLAERYPLIGGLDDRIEEVFAGIPRNSAPSTLHLGVLPYYALPPLWAHVVNEVLMRVLAFTGMLLLLRHNVLPDASDWVRCGAALCFSMLPFLPTGYLSIAGQPLLLHAILKLRERRAGVVDGLVIVAFPLYSSLIFIGLFVLAGLGALVLWDLVRRRRFPVELFLAGLVMGLLYAGSEYRLLYQTFGDGTYVSHRSEFDRMGTSGLGAIRNTLQTFFISHRHAPSAQLPFLLFAAALGLVVALRRGRRGDGGGPIQLGRDGRILLGTLLLCAAAAAMVGLWEWRGTQSFLGSTSFTPIRMFNFHRVQWFQPALFGIAFASGLHLVTRGIGYGRHVATLLLICQLGWLAWSAPTWAEKRDSGLTYRAYYSSALFEEIRTAIGRPAGSYRVVSFGMTPAPALYSGFHVMDAFVNDYPLEHKNRFRRAMARELEKDERLRRHFDGWGSHVDLFSSELGTVSGYGKTLYTKDAPKRAVEKLEIDTDALREMGVAYIMSAVEIRNHRELELRPMGTFERDDSPWRLIVYELGGPEE
jgi:hypothetical protein